MTRAANDVGFWIDFAPDTDDPRAKKHAEADRRGELHSALCALVGEHSIEDVEFMVRVIREDLDDAKTTERQEGIGPR